MPGLRMFKKEFYSHIGANEPIVAGTINLGNTKGRGSSTRMFNYCTQRSANPSECINQFITVKSTASSQPAPASWSQLGTTGFNSLIKSLAIGSDGKVYAAGSFTNGSGETYVAVYNGSTWSQLGTTGFNSYISTLAIGPDGKVYIGGNFTNGSGNYYVAVYNGSTWSQLGTDFNSPINTTAIGSDGKVYVGGNFTLAGSLTKLPTV
jgi:hypothetical protein